MLSNGSWTTNSLKTSLNLTSRLFLFQFAAVLFCYSVFLIILLFFRSAGSGLTHARKFTKGHHSPKTEISAKTIPQKGRGSPKSSRQNNPTVTAAKTSGSPGGRSLQTTEKWRCWWTKKEYPASAERNQKVPEHHESPYPKNCHFPALSAKLPPNCQLFEGEKWPFSSQLPSKPSKKRQSPIWWPFLRTQTLAPFTRNGWLSCRRISTWFVAFEAIVIASFKRREKPDI